MSESFAHALGRGGMMMHGAPPMNANTGGGSGGGSGVGGLGVGVGGMPVGMRMGGMGGPMSAQRGPISMQQQQQQSLAAATSFAASLAANSASAQAQQQQQQQPPSQQSPPAPSSSSLLSLHGFHAPSSTPSFANMSLNFPSQQQSQQSQQQQLASLQQARLQAQQQQQQQSGGGGGGGSGGGVLSGPSQPSFQSVSQNQQQRSSELMASMLKQQGARFDMSADFPALSDAQQQQQQQQQADSNFVIQKEDFPALGGGGGGSQQQRRPTPVVGPTRATSGHTTPAGGTTTQPSNPNSTLPTPSAASTSSSNPTAVATSAQLHSLVNVAPLRSSAMPRPGGTQQGKPLVNLDRYGLTGLLSVIRMTDPDLNTLALGTDLTTLGLNLNSSEVLYATFHSPCLDVPTRSEPDYVLPFPYYMQPPALKTSHLAKFTLETLFYIFYSMPRDTLQVFSAKELYKREWRYHKELKLWFSRATQAQAQQLTAAGGGDKKDASKSDKDGSKNDKEGSGDSPATTTPSSTTNTYLYFDINAWERRIFRETHLLQPSKFMTEEELTSI